MSFKKFITSYNDVLKECKYAKDKYGKLKMRQNTKTKVYEPMLEKPRDIQNLSGLYPHERKLLTQLYGTTDEFKEQEYTTKEANNDLYFSKKPVSQQMDESYKEKLDWLLRIFNKKEEPKKLLDQQEEEEKSSLAE